ncbi:MAG: BolA family transcriptional regulator [Rhodobacteraceae bacterium]|nr:BolA family transcriptional regulator [Alphaproteobacteria bacterium]NNF71700.1 BolA family transcriptional regulator [Paracoccaceae bacterium]NNK68693.1 BolA family transcriptional regulator [Paracoccaceae bacterium]
MGIADEMRNRLEAEFSPEVLTIEDESEAHRGHSGYQEGGESHWRITISAPAFGPMTRIERHRAVHSALGPEIVGRIHALALQISG